LFSNSEAKLLYKIIRGTTKGTLNQIKICK
jgi:hypothetical protein